MARHISNSIFVREKRLHVSAGKEQRDDKSSFDNNRLLSSSSSSTKSIVVDKNRFDRSLFSDTKSVRFGDCHIRSYNRILGDHPCVSAGCPVQLGWKIVAAESVSVDEFEEMRAARDNTLKVKDMKLSAKERRYILSDYSDVEIRREWRQYHRESNRDSVKEGLKQFRMIGAYYAGF
jgi:hypothetical protein